jgi:hypothetical protein
MPRYLLIESRDPFDSGGFAQRCDLAAALIADGAEVMVYLVENAVLAVRRGADLAELAQLARLGVPVVADEFALHERGIAAAELARTVKSVPLDTLLNELGSGARALWN